LLVASTVPAAQPEDVFDAVLYRGMRLPFNQEAASFLVRDSDCSVREVEWPRQNKSREATFYGTPPPGTFAIVHSHPDSLPLPSPRDGELARKSGLDVYVVTRGNVWKVRASDGNVRMLRKRERKFGSDCHQTQIAAAGD
jgi:proteasome lid subunit RPN8/RPN11